MRVLICIAALGAAALAGCGSGGNTENAGAPPTAPPPPGGAPAAAAAPNAVAGKAIFQAKCIACHGANGKGIGAGKPDFTDAAWQAKESDEELLHVIANGHKMMPPFKDKLTEQERKDVLAYVRTFAAK